MNKVLYVSAAQKDGRVDGASLAQAVQERIAHLNQEGFEVIAVTPITSAPVVTHQRYFQQSSVSIPHTEGILITAKQSS
ncbi:MAG: hypothetical protein N2C14_06115 [Planctomycetales bacterium]